MTYPRALVAALCVLLLLAGCEQSSVGQQEQIAGVATVLAGTPSVTPTSPPTATPTATATATATIGPSATPTAIPTPTITPLPPTATPNAALKGFSYCSQTAGDVGAGRFSAQLGGVTVEGFPAFERMTFAFTETLQSAAVSAVANCLSASDFVALSNEPVAPGSYVLQVQLANWLHDDAFRSSAISRTLTFTNTRIVRSIGFRYPEAADVGALIEVPLEQPLRFRTELARNPTRLIVEVARASELVASSDLLSVPSAQGMPQLDQPIFFLLNGDIWRSDKDATTNLTKSDDQETSLAVSPDGQRIAFCRASPGVDPDDALLGAPGDLWTMDFAGKAAKLLADQGYNCADPAFSPDGTQVAWSVDETGILPSLRSIWTVTAAGGRPQLVSGRNDEWSRSAPQWLVGGLVYAASSPDGRSTLFLRPQSGGEREIGAELVVGDRYVELGRPLADRSGNTFVVEARRARTPGSDLVLLDASGVEQGIVGSKGGSTERPYWVRPLAWADDGTLVYLTSECLSTLVQNYTLQARSSTGADQVLASGTALGGIGSAAAVGNGLAYVLVQQPQPGPRGPLAVAPGREASLWLWDLAADTRGKLYDGERAILDLAR